MYPPVLWQDTPKKHRQRRVSGADMSQLALLASQQEMGRFWGQSVKSRDSSGIPDELKKSSFHPSYLRHSCLPDSNSSWHHYLRNAESAFEEEVLSTVFADCFAQTEEGRAQQVPQAGAD